MNMKIIIPLLTISLSTPPLMRACATVQERRNRLRMRARRAKTRILSGRWARLIPLNVTTRALAALVTVNPNLSAAQKRHARRALNFNSMTSLHIYEEAIDSMKHLLSN